MSTLLPDDTAAQWSVPVCLPDGAGGYTQRLVPKASVPLYVSRYGAVLPENGVCPACQPDFKSCGSGCIPLSACCGECPPQHECDNGICVCVPDCTGAVCGDDGCGGTCGTCGANEVCDGGQCVCGPFFTYHEGSCVNPCTVTTCSCGLICAATPAGDAVCLANYQFACSERCTSDAECAGSAGGPTCLRPQGQCTTAVGACGNYTLC